MKGRLYQMVKTKSNCTYPLRKQVCSIEWQKLSAAKSEERSKMEELKKAQLRSFTLRKFELNFFS